MQSMTGMRRTGTLMAVAGLAGMALVYWLSFFWVSTEASQGVAQRIFYVHVPAAWTAFLAFGISALTSAMYLWLRDERFDRAALCAAEGGMIFATIMLTTGPLWGRIAWGTYWTWEPRLTLTLLLWFIFLGYFMVRSSTELWFRSLHPQPVVMRPQDGPALPGDMLTLLLTSLTAFTVLFFGLFLVRYALEGLRRELDVRARGAAAQPLTS
jgi:heme exporter protein C